MRHVPWTIVLAIALAWVSRLHAQEASPPRHGLYVSLTAGWGSLGFTCDDCEGIGRVGGATGGLRIGVAVSPQVLVGANVIGWARSWGSDSTEYLRTSFLATVTLYPSSAPNGLWITGGGGYSIYGEKLQPNELVIKTLEALARVGYDFRIAKNLSLAPYGEFGLSLGGKLKVNSQETDETANTNTFNLGVMLTLH